MSVISAALPLLPKPISVALGELAIAAGAAGHSVTLCYQGLPAPVLCNLYKYCITYAGPAEVRHVRTPKDIRDLTEVMVSVRLAIIYNARILSAASWAIQVAPGIEGAEIARPALFCNGDCLDLTDDPGATLVLRGDDAEAAAIPRWLTLMQPQAPPWHAVSSALTVQTEPALAPVLSSYEIDGAILTRFRDREVLRCLIVGAAVLRTAGQDTQELTELALTLDDYEQVRRLLQARLVGAADESCDPLAAAMVGRANVFLSIKYSDDVATDNPFNDGSLEPPQGNRPNQELVTRREVTDLGKPNSHLVRRLVACLQRRPDGYERFQRMGLIRRPPQRDAWRTLEIDALLGHLRPWSAKQVRTHFDKLHRTGMITAEREHSNGPWLYRLPEEVALRSTAFGGLPNLQENAPGVQTS